MTSINFTRVGRLLPLMVLAGAVAPALAQTEFGPPLTGTDQSCRSGVSGATPDGADTVRPPESQKCGVGAVARAEGTLAVGADALALETNATAIGRDTRAGGAGSTVLGAGATATGANSTALGSNARATHANATAVGAGAASSASNQVALGAAGTSVRVGDIGASTAAQAGPVAVATVDASGTLGRNMTIIPAVQALQAATSGLQTQQSLLVPAVQALQAATSGLQAQQSLLSGRVDALFDLRESDRRDSRRGVAAAVAIGDAPMPSSAGRTSYVFNLATFRGAQAVGGSIMHRLNTADPIALSVGFSYAGNRNNAARIGVAGEF